MKQVGSIVAAAVLLASIPVAHAADLRVKAPIAPPAPVESWTGPYLGIHGGWAWSDGLATAVSVSTAAIPLPPGAFFNPLSFEVGGNGGIVGGQFGYNWQVAPTFVVGVEGDMSASWLRGSQTMITSSSGFGGPPVAGIGSAFMSQKIDWLASLRGRLGYVAGPGLLYLTGGVAFAEIKDSANATTSVVGPGCCAFPASFTTTRTGFAVGGGYEAMLQSHWLLRAEYLYYGFDGLSRTVLPGVTTTPPTCNAFACVATYSWGKLGVSVARVGLSYKF